MPQVRASETAPPPSKRSQPEERPARHPDPSTSPPRPTSSAAGWAYFLDDFAATAAWAAANRAIGTRNGEQLT